MLNSGLGLPSPSSPPVGCVSPSDDRSLRGDLPVRDDLNGLYIPVCRTVDIRDLIIDCGTVLKNNSILILH